jgi:hypothetical protein
MSESVEFGQKTQGTLGLNFAQATLFSMGTIFLRQF